MTAKSHIPTTAWQAPSTQDRLLATARDLFWRRGYSNVPLRDIAKSAGVDVALISRYFGGKEGLFLQTLTGAFDVLPDPSATEQLGRDGLIEFIIDIFANDVEASAAPSVVDMIAVNGHDPDVGDLVTARQREHIHLPLAAILGSEARAELFMAVIVGCCISRSGKAGDAIFTEENAAQLRYMLQAAANFGDLRRS